VSRSCTLRPCASASPTTAARRCSAPSSTTDEPLSDFRAEALLDFFIAELGPPVYNQGVRDAAGYLQQKLSDIEGDVYEREPRL
jgi:uncharacterized protein (DUF2164 family)